MPTRPERLEGAIEGLLIGDALGVPYENRRPTHLPPRDQIEYEPPRGFERAHRGTPPGTWSDDGAQALCLLASLLKKDRLDPVDFGRRLCNWRLEGYMAVDGRVFDVGITTASALRAIEHGTPPLEAGLGDEVDNGNGSLMRVLPLALWHPGSDAELARDAELQSCLTHAHRRSRVCCALYCLWARRLLKESPDPWREAVAAFRLVYAADPDALEELEQSIRPDDPPPARGTGYVVDCLHSARVALEEPHYEAVVRAAIALGHDTDTTACVAGGLAGLRGGVGEIPERWRTGLRGRKLMRPLLNRLVAIDGAR
ncbi:MAG: ADP-ribosylglycohydrolase [Armatimonadetes bacterium]|jgi:ADP-ribosylglycohydrolase|nr:ADP-ribosylglycohydrolase [Armatimonadota bacterium]